MKVSFVINLRQYELAIVIFQGYLIDQVIADIEWLIMRLLLNFSLIGVVAVLLVNKLLRLEIKNSVLFVEKNKILLSL